MSAWTDIASTAGAFRGGAHEFLSKPFDLDEAVALANRSRFGLRGGIISADVGRAYEMALRIRTGGVTLNGGAGTQLSAGPFGGVKRSGYGRELGEDGLNEFTQTKLIEIQAG